MSASNYGWNTEFDTARHLMIHKMTERVSVVSDIKSGTMNVFKDGVKINSVNSPSITEYGKMLSKIYTDALELEKISM